MSPPLKLPSLWRTISRFSNNLLRLKDSRADSESIQLNRLAPTNLANTLAPRNAAHVTKIHGESKTRLYKIWKGIKERCHNPNNTAFRNYGGRGIGICDEWNGKNGYIPFREWALQNGYSDDLTIDRIDVNGNYAPSNCRWVTLTEQSRNKRTTILSTFNGETRTLKEWSEILGINYQTLYRRIFIYGWDTDKAFNHST